ncbi:DUF2986 domain-containing protein [Pseudoalteromonas sp. MMG010]|uniref:DUF2986 domain-containing protein n=1 Tax=Pseudoalteromonas sp. MMG010 TaxID=2822685 RepID=UPI001B39FFC1|nr:DUF2986 domain-containing protein [Pseudoalteromonas sp. MMG010]MBQ4833133.1 DUF2986 domain-containing protein [Pseudoalteromonas sp. MMG010]
MNRRKKIVTKFQKKDKRANAKLHKSNKPAYISKAERAKLTELEDNEQATNENAQLTEQTTR